MGLREGVRILSAIFLRRRTKNLFFQRWRHEASVKLRESKWAAVNRLCSTQNTLIRNAFGALRVRPLVRRTTYHHLTLLMHWRQKQELKLLLRTYWMVWKEKFLLKKARHSPVVNHCSSNHGSSSPAIQLPFYVINLQSLTLHPFDIALLHRPIWLTKQTLCHACVTFSTVQLQGVVNCDYHLCFGTPVRCYYLLRVVKVNQI